MTTTSKPRQAIDRRRFLRNASAAGGLSLCPSWPSLAKTKERGADPHFMITVYIFGGLDPMYMFDTRPFSLTDEHGLVHNYHSREEAAHQPYLWQGRNGQATLASGLTRPLLPYQQDITVMNGVMMAWQFDGHEQNANYILSGNPFGGEFYAPHINAASQRVRPIDYIQNGPIFGSTISNNAAGVTLNPALAQTMVSGLGNMRGFHFGDGSLEFVHRRMEQAATGKGAFSLGAAGMSDALRQAPDLASLFKGIDLGSAGLDQSEEAKENDPLQVDATMKVVTEFFRAGITQSAVLRPDLFDFDTHDPGSAQEQPKTIPQVITYLASIIRNLKETPYDQNRSFWDLTTILFTSEFGRTRRQPWAPDINKTGTDHNPLSNSVILGGKAVKQGCVFGASDGVTADEVLSGAHKFYDEEGLKTMGRPFDYRSMTVRPDLPAEFQPTDYLNFSAIINTLHRGFGVDPSLDRLTERNGKPFPTLGGLLA